MEHGSLEKRIKQHGTIVLVDDSQLAMEVMQEAIEFWLPGRKVISTSAIGPTVQYQAHEILNKLTGPALFLVDYHMPSKNGLQLIEELRKYAMVPVNFLLVTGETDHKILSMANRRGVDFFSKVPPDGSAGFNFGELFTSKIEFMEKQLEFVARRVIDPITGAYTMLGLSEQWVPVWNLMVREKTWTAVLFIDVNDFKPINDRFRVHEPGNKLLSAIAQAIRDHIRGTDSLGRMGDEFKVVMSGIKVDLNALEGERSKTKAEMRAEVMKYALDVGERIKLYIRELKVEVLPGEFISTSVSVGVAVIDPWTLRDNPGHGREIPLEDFEEINGQADNLSYADKFAHYKRLMEAGDSTAERKYLYYKDLWEKQAQAPPT
jgi:diguanylate cyclase (GGDEF)-like protein